SCTNSEACRFRMCSAMSYRSFTAASVALDASMIFADYGITRTVNLMRLGRGLGDRGSRRTAQGIVRGSRSRSRTLVLFHRRLMRQRLSTLGGKRDKGRGEQKNPQSAQQHLTSRREHRSFKAERLQAATDSGYHETHNANNTECAERAVHSAFRL